MRQRRRARPTRHHRRMWELLAALRRRLAEAEHGAACPRPVDDHEVQLATAVLAPSRDLAVDRAVAEFADRGRLLRRRRRGDAEHTPMAIVQAPREIAEDIRADQSGHRRSAVDEAADDGGSVGMAVVRDRVHQAGHRRAREHEGVRLEALRVEDRGIEPERSLAQAPAEVAARDDFVDLLDVVLADVTDPQAARTVEGRAERVAEAVGVDLAERAGLADERVVARDPILAVGRGPLPRVYPQDLP